MDIGLSVKYHVSLVLIVEKIDVALHPIDMVSVAVEQFGERVGSLAEHG